MLDFKSTLKMAINLLRVNMLRSALTSLGVIIGVSAVIIMLAVGTGAGLSRKICKTVLKLLYLGNCCNRTFW